MRRRDGQKEWADRMDRIERIIRHVDFTENLEKIKDAEETRRFCRHDMAHFLDVARIARIMNGEEHLQESVEMIYACALLHDIGKHRQYKEKIPHEQAGAEIAEGILADCGFSKEESDRILEAILNHRQPSAAMERNLKGLLYRADKASRACFACSQREQCNWADEKKNLKLVY